MLVFLISTIASMLVLWGVSYLFYLAVNRGLSGSARHQQLGRFGVASVIAVAPTALGWWLADGLMPVASLALAATLSVAWGVTYPLLYHLSNRRVSPDYDNYMDIAMGGYLYGLFSALCFAKYLWPVAAAIEVVVAMLLIFQWVYYGMYRSCIDTNGMKIVRDTNYNEIIEFSRSYPLVYTIIIVALLVGVTVAIVWVDAVGAIAFSPAASQWLMTVGFGLPAVAIGVFIFGGRRPPVARAGLIALYLTVREYVNTNRRYAAGRAERVGRLTVTQRGLKWSRPTTIVMVIGESASRDYMSAFTPMEHDTTPWLRSRLESDPAHFIKFPNTYASAMHTVSVLEKSLTECNQYNDKSFYSSASVVDMARAAGYRVHWYSNQGHLGAADTPVTLVADTADVARWTKQELNKLQYDESLLDFLDEVDPTVNNLIVLHLKGSHFNFLNRYPRQATVWGTPGVQDNIPNYENSLRYTDGFLAKVFDTCRGRFNMQAMLYFSDHGTIPSRRRTPGFDGFGHIRIPMFVYLGDDYIARHPEPAAALRANADRYFTNDLVYALFCGLLDIESNAYDPTESLADPRYRFTRDMLLSFDGTIHIADDPTPTN